MHENEKCKSFRIAPKLAKYSEKISSNFANCNALKKKHYTTLLPRSMHHTPHTHLHSNHKFLNPIIRSIIITDPKTKKQNDPRKEARKPLKMSGETKVADVASQLRQKLPVNRNSFMRLFEWYHRTYFRTNSFQPVVHAMIGAGVLGYLIEYPHIKHELEEEKKRAYDV